MGAYWSRVAQADGTNPASQRTIRQHYIDFYVGAPVLAAELAAGLPVAEANSTLWLLRNARAELAAAVAAPASRQPLPSREMDTICNGYMCNRDGDPVFAVGLNTWPASQPPFSTGAAGIGLSTLFMEVSRLLPNLTWAADDVAAIAAGLCQRH